MSESIYWLIGLCAIALAISIGSGFNVNVILSHLGDVIVIVFIGIVLLGICWGGCKRLKNR